jgi:hypothetical protein
VKDTLIGPLDGFGQHLPSANVSVPGIETQCSSVIVPPARPRR